MIPVCLALAAAQPGPCAQVATWRPAATDADRERLRDWRTAWTEALDQARAKAQTPPADPLFDLDHPLDRPLPPAGNYRCRFVKLGGAAGLATREWGRCRIDGDRFVKFDGPQRPTGRLYADGASRGVFLGTLLLGDEVRPLDHGRDVGRDMAGFVERIGEARWRVVLPYPRFESTLDLIELVPA
ncbi:MAG: DUF4893 domain-containing protein [Acetobacteraceae bacterium]|nr:DUF4893 domain-containing protein [Acetobacteraceae bacterium]